mmetsp:Transcript_42433/g.131038  ORF Transcript_42433/g.131038 Transcript_42433/m.131038 type:complete len:246 (-) Transcript_42433:1318-2055(-)
MCVRPSHRESLRRHRPMVVPWRGRQRSGPLRATAHGVHAHDAGGAAARGAGLGGRCPEERGIHSPVHRTDRSRRCRQRYDRRLHPRGTAARVGRSKRHTGDRRCVRPGVRGRVGRGGESSSRDTVSHNAAAARERHCRSAFIHDERDAVVRALRQSRSRVRGTRREAGRERGPRQGDRVVRGSGRWWSTRHAVPRCCHVRGRPLHLCSCGHDLSVHHRCIDGRAALGKAHFHHPFARGRRHRGEG